MNLQRIAGGACAVAGVTVLAGVGWGLITAAVLLFAVSFVDTARVGVTAVRDAWLRMWAWLITGGRQTRAAAAMPVAIVAVAVGLSVAVGVGWGLAAAGATTGLLSFVADRAE